MFSFIFFFLFISILFIFILGGSLIRGIIKLIFGNTSRQQYTRKSTNNQTQHSAQPQQDFSSANKKREKIFDESEGEYVDFEEIES